MSKRLRGTCIYCGKNKRLTDDHVPPKNLFATPRSAELVTVPCCEKCHRPTGKDDEYFRITICFREDVYEHPEVAKSHDSLRRAILRPEARRFMSSLFANIADKQVYSQSGLIYLGVKPAIKVDLERIHRVVSRTVRGLYYHHHERAFIPSEYAVVSVALETLPMKLDGISAGISLINALKSRSSLKIGDVLEYKYVTLASSPYVSTWALNFYNRVLFLTFTYPPGWVRPKDET